jgi:glycerophosphoryl diester phosphodiesterase
VEAVVAMVRSARARIVLAAEHDSIMQAIRATAPELPTSLATLEVAAFVGALQQETEPSIPDGAVALQIPPRFGDTTLVDAASVAAAHRLGAEVHVWTINDPTEARRLLDLGCDGIMTDVPHVIAPVIAERRASS